MSRKHHRRRRQKPRFKRDVESQTTLGISPSENIVAPGPQAIPAKILVSAYNAEHYEEKEITRIEECSTFLERYPVTWIDVDGLQDREAIKKLGELFGLHPLALEDVVHVHQRAKVEPYESHLFIVARLASGSDQVETEQVSMFVGTNFVLTFQEHPGDSFQAVRQRVRSACNHISKSGPDYLAYVILDAIIDSYFPFIDYFADRLDVLEDEVASHQGIEIVDAIHQLRSNLVLVRRAIRPHREAVYELIRDPHPVIREATRVYLRDCYDHTIQVLELLEVYHDICSDLRDYYLSMAGIRMNQVMKILTIIATVFMPLSFIASLFGMNFDTRHPWNMPELRSPYGYLYALGLMAVVAAGLIYSFWRRGWLGHSQNPIDPT